MIVFRVSSAIGTIIASMVLVCCWLAAIEDTELTSNTPGGCIKRFHELRDHSKSYSNYTVCITDELNSYYKISKDAYSLCRILAILCGFLWILTAVMAFFKATLYLVFGLVANIVFLASFATVVDRTRYNQQCELYSEMAACVFGERGYETAGRAFDTEEMTAMKHMHDSYELIWGSALACVILGTYQIGCAIASIYDEGLAIAELTGIEGLRCTTGLSINENEGGVVEGKVKTETKVEERVVVEDPPLDDLDRSYEVKVTSEIHLDQSQRRIPACIVRYEELKDEPEHKQ